MPIRSKHYVANVSDTTTTHPTMESAVSRSLAEVRREMEAGIRIEEFSISEVREFGWKVNYPLAETPITN